MMIWMPFTDTTEARYTDMARMMVETGDWITSQIEYGVPF
jgi:4-amino-4-deoxy-L-arabinose transferase-like glycosyltransferase